MPYLDRRTPGVYLTELSAFPPSVVGVPTAVPVFIGYTMKAEVQGKPVQFKPVKITSLADFQQVFGVADAPSYSLVSVPTPGPDNYDIKVWDPTASTPAFKFFLLHSANASFNLYNSMQLFYGNGGGECWVVSCGLYVEYDAAKVADALGAALAAAGEQKGPTITVIPDALLLPPDAPAQPWISTLYGNLATAMLKQCAELSDRVAVLDVYGTQYLGRPPADANTEVPTLDDLIDTFRANVGDAGLSYGMGYFPFLNTTVVPAGSLTYTAIGNSPAGTDGLGPLQSVLSWQNINLYGDPTVEGSRAAHVQAYIKAIATTDAAGVTGLNANLMASLPLLGEMLNVVAAKENVLPPSGAMAGVFAYVDRTSGVWNAPANLTLSSVVKPTYLLKAGEQDNMNMPVNGKAVDAIREFVGRGTVVWGARTLDGNSPDYRYIQVRRTLIYLEQSIKQALDPFVFAPNTGQTWSTVVSMVSGFLQGVWSRGGLMGAKATDAFSVQCGVGSTMTGQDVLNGYMIVQVVVQLVHPAEFIELTFKQKMQGVAG